jgi:hypothetical protein
VAAVDATLDAAATKVGEVTVMEAVVGLLVAKGWAALAVHRSCRSGNGTTCIANQLIRSCTSVYSQKSLHRLPRCRVMNGTWAVATAEMDMGMALVAVVVGRVEAGGEAEGLARDVVASALLVEVTDQVPMEAVVRAPAPRVVVAMGRVPMA